jgi:hypothetical protein
MTDKFEQWRAKVGAVFNVAPRIGSSKQTVWLTRSLPMNNFRNTFLNPGTHVCLDGPSGAGKTSLVLTFLEKERFPYAYVQITTSMTWPDLCRQLLLPVANDELGMEGRVELGLDRALPTAKFRVSLGTKGRASDALDYADKLAHSWKEHDLVQSLCAEGLTLVLDDAERASPELLTGLADACKLLTTRTAAPHVKMCFVGTDRLFTRLLHANRSLDQRVRQTTLGAFPSHVSSWHFLQIGFEHLGLRIPGTSLISAENDQQEACIEAVYEAADGLPKSLNALGQDIALRAHTRTAVDARHIKDAARDMCDENWRKYGRDFPRVLQCLDAQPICRALVRALYNNGIATIHYANDLFVLLSKDAALEGTILSEASVREGLNHLERVSFLVLTGRSGEVAYVTDPTAAHTLGVVMRSEGHATEMRAQLREKAAVTGSFPKQSRKGADVEAL